MTIWAAEIKGVEKLHDSFKGQHPKLDRELDKLVKTDDENIVLVYARRCLEVIITDLCERELKRDRGTEPLKGIIDRLNREKKVPQNIILSMQNLNSLSTFGAHPKDFDPMQVKTVLLDLSTTLNWYLKYMETQAPEAKEPGGPEGTRKEPASAKKLTVRTKNRILLASVIVLVCAVIVVVLILTDVINGGKGVKAGNIKSLVVLPFENYTGDEGLDYVAAGMHSFLIGDIAKLGALRVIGKTSSSVFKNTDKSAADIAEELNVDALVEPTVTCYGDSVCIQISVITPFPEEKQIWVADFREDKSKILNLYSRVTKQIANEIMIKLTPEEERLFARSGTVDREAYDAYLKGLQYWEKLGKEDLEKAMEYFQISIEKDPDWAPPYGGMANVWIGMAQMGYVPPDIARSKIYENLNKSLELDPDFPDSHNYKAMIAFTVEWNWEEAEKEFLTALAIKPNDAMARVSYAHLLMILQRHDEALTQSQLAVNLDPLNPVILAFHAFILIDVGNWDAAYEYCENALALDPQHPVAISAMKTVAYHLKRYDKAFETTKVYAQMSFPLKEDVMKDIEKIYKEKGYDAAIEEFIRQMEFQAEHGFVLPDPYWYLILKQYDKAMDCVEKEFEIHDQNTPYIVTGWAIMDSLYDNPRFIEIVKKMNLPLPKD